MVEKIKNLFLKEPLPFTNKRDLNWIFIKKAALASFTLLIVCLLLMPTPETSHADFAEERPQTYQEKEDEVERINKETLSVMGGFSQSGRTPKNLDHLYAQKQASSGSKGSTSMVIARTDLQSGNTLPMSFPIPLMLPASINVESQQIPVMAVVTNDVYYKDNLAIPRGSALFGHARIADNDRVQIDWTQVQFENGNEKKIQATTFGSDGRMGVVGISNGNGTTNAVGQALTRMIGAYAEGSQETGPFGANRGGHTNGLRNAVAETARDRSEAWAQDLQKQIRWVTLKEGTAFTALVTQPFIFRDPGAQYGE